MHCSDSTMGDWQAHNVEAEKGWLFSHALQSCDCSIVGHWSDKTKIRIIINKFKLLCVNAKYLSLNVMSAVQQVCQSILHSFTCCCAIFRGA